MTSYGNVFFNNFTGFTLKPTIHDATLLHATFACNKVACNKVTYTAQQCCMQHIACNTFHATMLHAIFNFHATLLHATMLRATINIHGATILFATLLHVKFNIHDATKLQATVACNFVASCMVGLSCKFIDKYAQIVYHLSENYHISNVISKITRMQ